MMSNPNKRKTRPKFGVDLDGVVFAYDIGACIALKLRGVDIEVRESYHWNDIQERVSEEDWRWLWNEGSRSCFEHAPAYPGIATQLRSIQDIVDLVIITHRPKGVIDITLRKLADMRLRPVAVHHVQGLDKADVEPDCIGYVDDKVENVLDLASRHEVPVFMPRKPWNRALHDPSDSGYSITMDIRPYDNFEEVTQWLTTSNTLS